MPTTWAALAIDLTKTEGRESIPTSSFTAKMQTAAKVTFRQESRFYLEGVVNSQGVTETVFWDNIADLATTTDLYEAVQNALINALLHVWYQGAFASATGTDLERAENYKLDLRTSLKGMVGLVRRAIHQDELVYSGDDDVTRDKINLTPVIHV